MSSEPDRAALAHATDHVARGLSQLTQRWRGLPGVSAILSSHLAEVQAIEDALWSILLLTLDTATAAQLDQIATILGEARLTLGDDDLRTVLRARILANRSSGSVDELVAILELFVEAPYLTLEEFFPAGVLASSSVFPTVPAARIGALLRRATAGGVGEQFVAPTRAVGGFRFSMTDETTASSKGFSDTAQTSGGHLAGVY